MLLNRRGFATSVVCRQCGATLECPNCSLSLTVHRAARRARCHYCNYAIPVPKACLQCGGQYLEQVGFRHRAGRGRAPGARSRGARRPGRPRHHAPARRDRGVLRRFAAAEIDILVGTQMLAKGHDFPTCHAGRRHLRRRRARAWRTSAPPSAPSSCSRRSRAAPAAATRPRRSDRADAVSARTTASATRAGRTTSRSTTRRFSFRQAMRYPPAVEPDQRRRPVARRSRPR